MSEEYTKPQFNTSKSTGLESNVAAALTYSLGLVSGILFLIVEPDDKFVRFHAYQSVLANLIAIIGPAILFFTIIGILLIPFFYIAVFVFWILLMFKAYQGEKYKLPWLGNIAERQK
jgi:uncharacterized membrane protein